MTDQWKQGPIIGVWAMVVLTRGMKRSWGWEERSRRRKEAERGGGCDHKSICNGSWLIDGNGSSTELHG